MIQKMIKVDYVGVNLSFYDFLFQNNKKKPQKTHFKQALIKIGNSLN
jgi:hypothetical protein